MQVARAWLMALCITSGNRRIRSQLTVTGWCCYCSVAVSHYWLFQDWGILGGTGDTSLLVGQDSSRETREQDGAGSDDDSAAPARSGALSGIKELTAILSTNTQQYLD